VLTKTKSKLSAIKLTPARRKAGRLTLSDYRSLAENSPDLVDRFDRHFRHIYTNPAAARLHGVGPEKIVGKTSREMAVPEPFCTLWEERIRKVFETGKPLLVRDTFQSAVSAGYYESRCVPEFGRNGAVRSVLVVSRDVTSFLQAEEAMRENETLFRKIIEHSPISMAIVGMDGVIEYINRKAIETFGYSPEDIPTMDEWWAKAYPDATYRKAVITQWMGHVHAALAENVEIEGSEYRVTCKDGTEKIMYIFGVPVVSKVFVMFNDVSAYKALQAELENYRDELEHKVKDRTAKLQMLAEEVIRVEQRERLRIAHVLHEDLQQWLAAAKFRVGELREQIVESTLNAATDRLQHMLEKAIEVTRTLAIDLHPPIIHEQGLQAALRWLARDMKNKFDLVAKVKVERVSERVAGEVRIFVFNAVRELLMNVRKHAGVNTVSVTVKPVGRSLFRVEVADKGCGFDSSRNGGDKFGLFSIYERVDVLGGTMEIDSKPGQGTRIMITLPVKSREAASRKRRETGSF